MWYLLILILLFGFIVCVNNINVFEELLEIINVKFSCWLDLMFILFDNFEVIVVVDVVGRVWYIVVCDNGDIYI